MGNALYDKGREKFLNGDIDWANDDIKVALIDTAEYTVDLAADEFLDDISGDAIVATSGNLGGKSSTAGVADATDVTLSSVSGAVSEALVIYKDTTVAGTSPLIAYFDTPTSGLPVTPNGGDIIIQWDNGASKIFKL